jgi:hypothetical protein
MVELTGLTVAEPESGRAAELMLGLMLTEVAFVLVQVSTTGWPDEI